MVSAAAGAEAEAGRWRSGRRRLRSGLPLETRQPGLLGPEQRFDRREAILDRPLGLHDA